MNNTQHIASDQPKPLARPIIEGVDSTIYVGEFDGFVAAQRAQADLTKGGWLVVDCHMGMASDHYYRTTGGTYGKRVWIIKALKPDAPQNH